MDNSQDQFELKKLKIQNLKKGKFLKLILWIFFIGYVLFCFIMWIVILVEGFFVGSTLLILLMMISGLIFVLVMEMLINFFISNTSLEIGNLNNKTNKNSRNNSIETNKNTEEINWKEV